MVSQEFMASTKPMLKDLLFLYPLICFEFCYHPHALLLLIESVEVTFTVNKQDNQEHKTGFSYLSTALSPENRFESPVFIIDFFNTKTYQCDCPKEVMRTKIVKRKKKKINS